MIGLNIVRKPGGDIYEDGTTPGVTPPAPVLYCGLDEGAIHRKSHENSNSV